MSDGAVEPLQPARVAWHPGYLSPPLPPTDYLLGPEDMQWDNDLDMAWITLTLRGRAEISASAKQLNYWRPTGGT